ncbi:hypothetical protein M0638_23700 [Roseomonas sp. NAR14]|uniref:Uncharacterized protein n=1 Tax=Roseomonas acroporae TaxID=2937791 RepID=A0A9X2BYW0_9PROT|nr:hypothetical protein [Roseomonas acroporae]
MPPTIGKKPACPSRPTPLAGIAFPEPGERAEASRLLADHRTDAGREKVRMPRDGGPTGLPGASARDEEAS